MRGNQRLRYAGLAAHHRHKLGGRPPISRSPPKAKAPFREALALWLIPLEVAH